MRLSARSFFGALLGFIVGALVMFLLIVLRVPILPAVAVHIAFRIGIPRDNSSGTAVIIFSILLGAAGSLLSLGNGIASIIHYPKYGNILGIAFDFIDMLLIASSTIFVVASCKEK